MLGLGFLIGQRDRNFKLDAAYRRLRCFGFTLRSKSNGTHEYSDPNLCSRSFFSGYSNVKLHDLAPERRTPC